ncbi:nitroreductase/quinone reductase family protein [Streptomyces sp. NPDC012888]|uniref:nitroreductase/quinone reductase family protein n=1 Tax=Streptomyces sp. NPDC012888 TaxID=3364855 RepID=UPI0036A861AA
MSSETFESFNQHVIDEFRANGGRVGGPFEGARLVLLTTTGARSGREHTVPLGLLSDGAGQAVVVGSAAGSDRHPAWFHNVLAHPLVTVETGGETYEAVAVPAEGARRDELFARIVREEPGYGEYQERTRRVIPVVVLQRTVEVTASEGGLAGKLLEVHGWLRAQLALVREEAGADGGAGAFGLRLRQHCLAFCHSLHVHHTSEDTGLFPWLAGQYPELAGFFRRIDEEHRRVADLKDAIVGALDDPGRAGLVDRLAELSAELEEHLDREEAQLLPVLRTLGA